MLQWRIFARAARGCGTARHGTTRGVESRRGTLATNYHLHQRQFYFTMLGLSSRKTFMESLGRSSLYLRCAYLRYIACSWKPFNTPRYP